MDYGKIVSSLRELSLRAGEAIMEVYNKPDFDVHAKSDDSPVTEADLAADKIICQGLAEAFPDIRIVTEEQADTHIDTGGVFFLVDPLDGTKEFVHRRGDFTVNIALVENGVPTRGVVYAPAKNRLFYTDADGKSVEEAGPHSTDEIGTLTPMSVSKPNTDALVVVASKSHRDQATDDYINTYNVSDFRSAGSSLKFCLVAAGEADLYPRLGRTMEWDTAAGHSVLIGAGGKVVRFDDHSDLGYGKPGLDNPFFVAYAPGIPLNQG